MSALLSCDTAVYGIWHEIFPDLGSYGSLFWVPVFSVYPGEMAGTAAEVVQEKRHCLLCSRPVTLCGGGRLDFK